MSSFTMVALKDSCHFSKGDTLRVQNGRIQWPKTKVWSNPYTDFWSLVYFNDWLDSLRLLIVESSLHVYKYVVPGVVVKTDDGCKYTAYQTEKGIALAPKDDNLLHIYLSEYNSSLIHPDSEKTIMYIHNVLPEKMAEEKHCTLIFNRKELPID